MIKVVELTAGQMTLPIFIMDTVTGYTGIDVMTKPGVYSEICTNGFTLPVFKAEGTVGAYNTSMITLLPYQKDDSAEEKQLESCTADVANLLSMPATAAKVVISQLPAEKREVLETAVEVIRFYEKMTVNTKIFLPDDAYFLLDEEDAKKMRTSRPSYVIKSIDNQEIVQESDSATFGIVLPDVSAIHGTDAYEPSALDLLRVLAPCRKETAPGNFTYDGVYHTPYYRVDPKIRGITPTHLKHINGLPSNDTVGVMPFERHMYTNLNTFVCADTSRYVEEIANSIFFSTSYGQRFAKAAGCRSVEVLAELAADFSSDVPDGFYCDVSFNDLSAAFESPTEGKDAVRRVLMNGIKTTSDFWIRLAENAQDGTFVDTDMLPFKLQIDDATQSQLTSLFISKSIISYPMFKFLIALCQAAYRVNWGHTGAAYAVTDFVTETGIDYMSKLMCSFLRSKFSKNPGKEIDFSDLYGAEAVPTEQESEEMAYDETSDDLVVPFDRYITKETMNRIANNSLPSDFFTTAPSGAESAEASIVEYWRKVPGDMNLEYYLKNIFMASGNVKVLIEAFLKTCRWGVNKPTMLVATEVANSKTVFDFNTGREIPNTAVVDESALKKVNGCTYTFEKLLVCSDIGANRNSIVGFLLSKDYGIKKYFLASWLDLAEMVNKKEIDIAEFKGVTAVYLDDSTLSNIGDFETSGFGFHISDGNREKSVELNVKATELSELAILITPKILKSAAYLRAKQNKDIVTLKDRQYKILEKYSKAVLDVSGTDLSKYDGVTDTVALCSVSTEVAKVYNSEPAVKDVNENRAAAALSNLNLNVDNASFRSDELVGQFVIISDTNMISGLPAIEFTDAKVASVAKRLRNRIVLLMLEKEDCLLLCRKDISAQEVKIAGGNIAHKSYDVFAKAIPALKAGKVIRTSYGSANDVPIYLHDSLKGII